jgi:CRP-like cAMP-binding protein
MSRQIGDIPTRTFNPGDVIFKEGDDAKGEAFMLHIGKVEIKKLIAGEQRLLNTIGKGELLGELALFRNAPRSATAIATEAVTLMVIPANRLDHMVRSNPALAAALIKTSPTHAPGRRRRRTPKGARNGLAPPQPSTASATA